MRLSSKLRGPLPCQLFYHLQTNKQPFVGSLRSTLKRSLSSTPLQWLRERNSEDNNQIQAIQYIPIEETEQIEKYQPGGYHPVKINDCFGLYNRYQVIHKLGFGGHSTTWLARDKTKDSYVALKIGIASDSGTCQESRMLQYLGESLRDKADIEHVPTIQDVFTHNGINGTHDCLVTQPGICSLAASKSASKGIWLFDLAVARRITAQLIYTTALLHSQGIVHGDLHPGNILFSLPRWFHSLSLNDLHAKYTGPMKHAVSRLDGAAPLPANVPAYVVPPIWLGKPCESMTVADANVIVTDFGEAWRPAVSHRYTLNTPLSYRPPESIFAEAENQPISFAADIWTLGCTIYDLFARGTLFEGFVPDEHDVFAENISALGKPPEAWWNSWRARGEFFDADGQDWDVKRSRISDGKYCPLDTRVDYIREDREGKISDEELADLLSILASMIRWRPEDRTSAQAVLVGRWIMKWGG